MAWRDVAAWLAAAAADTDDRRGDELRADPVPRSRLGREEQWDGTATLGRGWLVGARVSDLPMLDE